MRSRIEPLLAGRAGAEVWPFGSLADDVIGLSQGCWLERQRGDDPWWRGLCRDGILLRPTLKP